MCAGAAPEEDVSRFVSVLKQYDQEDGAALKVLYLQAIEEILPGVAEFIVAAATVPRIRAEVALALPHNQLQHGRAEFCNGRVLQLRGHSLLLHDRRPGRTGPLGRQVPRSSRMAVFSSSDAGPVTLLDMDMDFLVVDAYAVALTVEPAEIADMVSVVSGIINSALRDEIAQRSSHEAIGARVILDQEGAPVFHEDGGRYAPIYR